ncbi:MAG: phosphate signaling complex protein PhoU [Myxococcales bacterium]
MPRHTDREYESELERLRERILYMGARVEKLVSTAFAALEQRDPTPAAAAIGMDPEIDHLEIEVDELCLRVLARRQPVASDLRFITTTLKLVTDLERVADLGVNIAERVVELAGLAEVKTVHERLQEMASISLGMLRDALDAFVSADALKAEQIMDRDAAVDSLYSSIFPTLVAQITADIHHVEQATRLQSIGKYIERIADHATNIAEMVVFMVRGQDIRHHGDFGVGHG